MLAEKDRRLHDVYRSRIRSIIFSLQGDSFMSDLVGMQMYAG